MPSSFRTQGQGIVQGVMQDMVQGMAQTMVQDKTGKAEQAKDLLNLLAAEHRRIKRRASGISSGPGLVQLVVLRPGFLQGKAQADTCTAIKSLVQECDSVIAIDKETLGLFLPCASLALARSFLKKALASLAPQKAQGLVITISDSAWDDFCPSDIEDRIRAELTKGGTRQKHIVLGRDKLSDQARVSAAERSFLLSPL